MDITKIEEKWRKRWQEAKIFETKDKGKKYYVLDAIVYS